MTVETPSADEYIQSILTAVHRIIEHPDKDTWGMTLGLREIDDLIWYLVDEGEL